MVTLSDKKGKTTFYSITNNTTGKYYSVAFIWIVCGKSLSVTIQTKEITVLPCGAVYYAMLYKVVSGNDPLNALCLIIKSTAHCLINFLTKNRALHVNNITIYWTRLLLSYGFMRSTSLLHVAAGRLWILTATGIDNEGYMVYEDKGIKERANYCGWELQNT